MSEVADLRAACGIEGDWGGTPWGDAILDLLDRLEATERDRDAWQGQVVTIRAQQRDALRRAERAEAVVREAHAYCARPEGVCLPKEPLR